MTTLLDYTTYDTVRSILGVSSEELTDTTLALDIYLYDLRLELGELSSTMIATYDSVNAIDPGSRSALQQSFYEAVRLFSGYAIAKQLLNSLPMFAPKVITDGKAMFGRHSDSPYKSVIARVESGYMKYRDYLSDKFNALTSSSIAGITSTTLLTVSSPDFDPVIGS